MQLKSSFLPCPALFSPDISRRFLLPGTALKKLSIATRSWGRRCYNGHRRLVTGMFANLMPTIYIWPIKLNFCFFQRKKLCLWMCGLSWIRLRSLSKKNQEKSAVWLKAHGLSVVNVGRWRERSLKMAMRDVKMVVETCAIGGCYIVVSASNSFNQQSCSPLSRRWNPCSKAGILHTSHGIIWILAGYNDVILPILLILLFFDLSFLYIIPTEPICQTFADVHSSIARLDCLQQIFDECWALSLRQSHDCYAYVHDEFFVTGAVYRSTFPVPKHGQSQRKLEDSC